MTKINCILTGCEYNTGCCITSLDNGVCNKESITLDINQEDVMFECQDYIIDVDKPITCTSCQLSRDGEIRLQPALEFDYVDTDDIPF